ncbi:MAG: DUF2249 domain-containing protein [Bacillota bacterium]|nr:DUF2249 domain-containing protein [Bacillota bacterium]
MTEEARPGSVEPGREASLERNRGAAQRIVRHHGRLLAGLEERSLELAAAPEAGWSDARRALLAYVDEEILPHARGEETTLYRRAAELPGLALLVHSLRLEHLRIGELREAVGRAVPPVEAASLARALLELFRLHAEKENVYVVAALADDGATDLESLLGELHERSRPDGRVLDVRHLPPAERHRLIFATWEGLAPGDSFLLVNDHDPVPLYYQLSAERPGRFTWDVVEAGPTVWRVRLGRSAE